MPDGLSYPLRGLDCSGISRRRYRQRAAIAADSVSIADAFGPVGIADTASYQFEGGDFAVRAVREANGQRDPIEPCVDRLDKRHCLRPFSASYAAPVSRAIASAFA